MLYYLGKVYQLLFCHQFTIIPSGFLELQAWIKFRNFYSTDVQRKPQIVNTFALKALFSAIYWLKSPRSGNRFYWLEINWDRAAAHSVLFSSDFVSAEFTCCCYYCSCSERFATKLLAGAFIACTQPREPISQASPGRDTKCQSQAE